MLFNQEGTTEGGAHLLAAVLQVAHEALLHCVKVGELLCDGLVLALHVLGGLLEVLAALDAGCRDFEGALRTVEESQLRRRKAKGERE